MSKFGQIWTTTKGVKQRMEDANLSLVAAGGAFFVMLSLFPALAAVIAIVGFFADPSIIDDQLGLLSDFVPEQVMGILESQVVRLVEASSGSAVGWATLFSILAALWSARRGTDGLIQAVNRVYGLPMRGGLRAAMTALLLTMALISVATIAVLALVVVPIILAFLPLGPFAGFAFSVARWGVALGVVISGIWVLYRYAPNKKNFQISWITPGSMMAVGVWFAASWGFSYYLTNFGSYNEVYGSIGAVIALLMFLYLSIFIVLLGATLNAELDGSRPDATPKAHEDAAPVTQAATYEGSETSGEASIHR